MKQSFDKGTGSDCAGNAHISVRSTQELQTHQGLVVITEAGKELIGGIK